MERVSRADQIFRGRKNFDGTHTFPLPDRLRNDPTYLYRLSWKHTPRVSPDWSDLIRAVRGSGDVAWFCDNGVFDDTTPDALWDALLDAPERLMMTPNVWHELKGWMSRRPGHPVHKAIKGGNDTGFGFRNPPDPREKGRWTFEYYVGLLALRHDALDRMHRAFRRKNGRDPDGNERRALAAELQTALGDRALSIAKKPAGLLTDETLVYLAVEHALTTGRQTVILTKDGDVEEQFFRLLWLIETHYRGMLLAERYAKTFSNFKIRSFPEKLLGHPAFPFEPTNAILIERDAEMRNILPPRPRFVAISCINVGHYFSSMAFGAEQEMGKVLDIKEATEGRNTSLLGDRNLHASVAQLPVGGDRDYAAVAYDRFETTQPSALRIPKLDVMQAVGVKERYGKLVPTPARLTGPDPRWQRILRWRISH